ncbi:hypothetical protein LV75_005531 [Actinokineospora diospyrosa]|uniref:Uncharacterized protein n=1 Tax=Actinokineospora diospyrosa TaxID=103728 RepID=A0ABT1IK29_9PSEU|nr:hypothetical protein [Actinokineospora diospyrosa]
MGWTCFAWGDGSRSVASRQGHAFRPLLCGPATGVVGAPHKTGPPHRAQLENRGSGPRLPPGNEASDPRVAEVAARRRGRPPEPKAEARSSCPALPTPAYAKINLIESPQIHSLPRRTDTTGAANNALWTTEDVVDNQPPTRRHNPAPQQDQLPQKPPIYSLPTHPHRTGASTSPWGRSTRLWTTPTQAHTLKRLKRKTAVRVLVASSQPPARPRCGGLPGARLLGGDRGPSGPARQAGDPSSAPRLSTRSPGPVLSQPGRRPKGDTVSGMAGRSWRGHRVIGAFGP